jgi:CBS domain-containing protein
MKIEVIVMKAKEMMEKEVITVKEDTTIQEIAKILIEHKISGVPVVNSEGSLVGIVTEGDLLHKETSPRLPNFVNILGAIIYYNGVERYHEEFKKLMAGQAIEIMTDSVVTVSEDVDIDEVARLMIKHSIKRIPVIKGDKIVGIISRSDIIKILLN